MPWFKRLFPSSLKDIGKHFINAVLRPLGWRLAPTGAMTLEGNWYPSPIDGLISQHQPPSAQDAGFRETLKHLAKYDAFEGLEAAIQGDTYLQRLYLASQLAAAASRLAGDFVEFGTYRGATAYCILKSTTDSQHPKKIFLYDTFAGIPQEGLTDRESEVGLAGRHTNTSSQRVAEMLNSFNHRVEFREGLIPDTLDDSGPEAIAFMHVDLNLSAPTKAALQWAFPRWTTGGICLLDDYLWEGFEDQRAVVEAFFRERGLTVIGLPTGQGIVLNHQDTHVAQ